MDRASSISVRLAVRIVAACAAAALAAGCSDDSEGKLVASAQKHLARRDGNAAVIEAKRALDKNARSGEARRVLGAALLDGGDPVAAEVELRKALEYGAPDSQVLPDLARAMLSTRQAAKVIAQFSATTLADPQAQAALRTWVAAAYAQQGQTERAEQELAAALAARPLFAPATLVQARLKAVAGNVDGALQLLDGLLASDPANAHAGVAKAQVLWLGKGDAAGALDAARKVLASDAGNVAAQSEIVTILFAQGDSAGARKQFEALRKSAPAHPETVFFEAQFAYVDKNYARARELAEAILKNLPDHIRALELAGAAAYQLHNDQQAQADLGRALRVMPSLVLARRILAQSYLRAEQPSRAVEVLAPLVEGDRPDPEALALTGSAWLQIGDAKRADAAFARAARLAPDDVKVRTQAALGMLDAGRTELALRDLETLAAGDKGARADLSLVSARIAQGDMKAALGALDALERKMPDQPLPQQLRGQVLVSLRDADGARRSFQTALARDPKYFPAVAALASMDVAMGKPAEARQRVTAFLKASPRHGQAMLLMADIPAAGGLPAPDALKWLADAVRANPGDARMHQALVARHIKLGDRPAALAAAQAAAVALPNDLGIMQMLGRTQLLAGQAQQAVSTLRKRADLQPASALAQLDLAEAYVAAKDDEAAGRALRKAVELDPKLGEARHALAMLALRAGRFGDALAIAQAMQKLEPKGALGYATEGDIETQRRNWTGAAAAYRKALELSSASEAAIKLHAVLRAGGKPAEADRLAADWERRRPNDPAFRFYLGDLALQGKDYATAESHYRAVLVEQPTNALATNNVAWLMHLQSKPGALSMAERANALLPNRAPILDTLATIQAASGKVPEAVKSQQQAVAASPLDYRLQLKLARYLVRAGRRDEARDQLDALARLGERFAAQDEVRKLRASL